MDTPSRKIRAGRGTVLQHFRHSSWAPLSFHSKKLSPADSPSVQRHGGEDASAAEGGFGGKSLFYVLAVRDALGPPQPQERASEADWRFFCRVGGWHTVDPPWIIPVGAQFLGLAQLVLPCQRWVLASLDQVVNRVAEGLGAEIKRLRLENQLFRVRAVIWVGSSSPHLLAC